MSVLASRSVLHVVDDSELHRRPTRTEYTGRALAYDATSDPNDGGSGGGPSGLIYNARTVKEVGPGVEIGTVGSSGAARAPMRYELELTITAALAQFYLYVSHMKSGSTEAAARPTAPAETSRPMKFATMRPAWDPTPTLSIRATSTWTAAAKTSYQTLTSATVHSGIGQAVDPQNGTWALANRTDSTTNLQYRDDFQFVTNPMLNGAGLDLVSGMHPSSAITGVLPVALIIQTTPL